MSGVAMSIPEGTHFGANRAPFSVGAWLAREFRRERHGPKIVGFLFGRSSRTAEGWMRRGKTPNADALAQALRHPKFRERFLAALDAERKGEIS